MPLVISYGMSRSRARLDVLQEQWRGCRRCPLHRSRSRVCFGAGSSEALIMVVSERPNKAEDSCGLPMQSEAAFYSWQRAMSECGLVPERDLFGTWAVKCLPPKGDDGFAIELPDSAWDNCQELFNAQLEAVNPAFVVLQGKGATKFVLGDTRSTKDFLGHIRKFGHERLALSTHNPAGLFGDREYLIREYVDHWRELCYRIHVLGRMWRPNAPLFQSGWAFPDPMIEAS